MNVLQKLRTKMILFEPTTSRTLGFFGPAMRPDGLEKTIIQGKVEGTGARGRPSSKAKWKAWEQEEDHHPRQSGRHGSKRKTIIQGKVEGTGARGRPSSKAKWKAWEQEEEHAERGILTSRCGLDANHIKHPS